ncbi:hypothetical protein G3570_06010 [Balneolaceae bacterium YR4-1]|uniref:Uncharacterized protein n=1 Tax=Halalkalibaculum roseum TaxID=2709311 RepID=A0A6M1T089_9BACT|nr:hypothetical protein [Halalkalibaculum roseum]NGP76177.1 hypothetical protein [Halalkalibaculum roseum]
MKSKKRDRVKQLKRELKWLDPDQELVHEEDDITYKKPETLKESLSRGFRSFLAIVLCLIIPVLWYFDWNISAFADNTSGTVTGTEVVQDGVAPLPPAPDVPVVSSFDGSLLDYTSALKEAGLLDSYSSPAVNAFYENDVPVSYLIDLNEAGLVDEFSFPAIIAFFQNQVPFDYLGSLKDANLLDELSFPAVVAFYENNVSLDYLTSFDEAGYLDEFSFPAIVAYFQNGVSIEFLNELQERDLLGDLSFPAVVEMYQNN